jgi:hypothetical protein
MFILMKLGECMVRMVCYNQYEREKGCSLEGSIVMRAYSSLVERIGYPEVAERQQNNISGPTQCKGSLGNKSLQLHAPKNANRSTLTALPAAYPPSLIQRTPSLTQKRNPAKCH